MKQLLGCSNSGRESQELEKVPGVAVQRKGGSGTNRALLLPQPLPSTHSSGLAVPEPRCAGTLKSSSRLYCFLPERPENKPRM